MPNTLTAILPTIYEALRMVSREQVGYIMAAYRNARLERAGLNQTISYPIVPPVVGEDITPAMTVPATGTQTITNGEAKITKMRAFPILWTGEEEKALTNGDVSMFGPVQRDQIAQAFRACCNEIEADLATAIKTGASRAFGTAGTAPFNTANDLTDLAQVEKILTDNGAPATDRHLVLNSTGYANFAKQSNLTKVNEAGANDLLRQGVITEPLWGFGIHRSGQITTHTKGTGASATTNNAGYAIGATVITLASAGTGTILAGDDITFAGDSNKYQVVSGDADVSNGGTITIAEPGLRVAIAASATAITVGNSYTPNSAFQRNALHLIARPPALPGQSTGQGRDAAIDSEMVVDPISGLVFEIRRYAGYYMERTQIGMSWGVATPNPAHAAILFG